MNDYFYCELCKKDFHGLMSFASHVAQIHGISAPQYWDKYGYNRRGLGEKTKKQKEMEELLKPEKVVFT